MTFPNAPTTANAFGNAPKPTPPDPRPAAVDFALRLAAIRGTSGPKEVTDASMLIADSETILTFLKRGSAL